MVGSLPGTRKTLALAWLAEQTNPKHTRAPSIQPRPMTLLLVDLRHSRRGADDRPALPRAPANSSPERRRSIRTIATLSANGVISRDPLELRGLIALCRDP